MNVPYRTAIHDANNRKKCMLASVREKKARFERP